MHTIDLEPYQYSGTSIRGIRLVDPANPMIEHLTKFLAESEGGYGEDEPEREDDDDEPDRDKGDSESCKTKIVLKQKLNV